MEIKQLFDDVTSIKVDEARLKANLEAQERRHELLVKGMESHPMHKELEHLEQLAAALKNDETHYTFILDNVLAKGYLQDERIRFVDEFKDPTFIMRLIKIVAKHVKLEIPNREEINALEVLKRKIDDERIYDPDIMKFTARIREEIFQHLLELNKKHKSQALKKLLTQIQKSDNLIHLNRYMDEIKMFQDMLYRVEHDDPSWTYFRHKLYDHRSEYAEIIKNRYGHKDYAEIFAQTFQKHHQDRNATIRMLKDIIAKLSSPEARTNTEKRGMVELRNLIARTLQFMKSQLESLRKEMLVACEKRIEDIKSGKTSIKSSLNRLEKAEQKLIQNIAGLGHVLAEPSSSDVLAPVHALLSQPGRVKEGIEMLRSLSSQNKISYYDYLRILTDLRSSRDNYIRQTKEWKRAVIRRGATPEETQRIAEFDKAIVWYDKELVMIEKEIDSVAHQVRQLQRLQQSEIQKLDRLLAKDKDLEKFRSDGPQGSVPPA